MLDHMAEVDEPLRFHIVHNVTAAISSQIRLSTTEAGALFHQP